MTHKLKAYLATGRISNLPTVWCNCLTAALLIFHQSQQGVSTFHHLSSSPSAIPISLMLLLASTAFYIGGCFAGDYYDRDFDAEHKPERPIPSGIISKHTVLAYSIFLFFIAFFGAILVPAFIFPHSATSSHTLTTTILLFLAITQYSKHHKKSLYIGLPLIGLCRFFLILFAAAVASTMVNTQLTIGDYTHTKFAPYFILPIILFASAVCIYTICFASVARTESSDSPITWRNALRYTMLGLPAIALIDHPSAYNSLFGIIALAIYALWILHAFSYLNKNKGIYVSKCLAGFCLLDTCFVAQFGWIWPIICLVLFGIALLLQKIAPAT